MWSTSNIRLFLVAPLILASLGCCQTSTSNTTLVVNAQNHDISLEAGQNLTVTFEVTQLTLELSQVRGSRNISIHLVSTDVSVATIYPTDIPISMDPQQESLNISLLVRALDAGKVTITANTSDSAADVSQAFIRVTVSYSDALNVLSSVVGWIYFIAWSISFYPQIYENWKRRSVIGLNFDFLGLNIIGFSLYGIFNIGLYSIPQIKAEYFQRHPTGVNPVQLNDVIFALHAAFACAVTITQCCLYERGQQTISRPCKLFVAAIAALLFISLICSIASVLAWLDFLYICSYVKLAITLIKYIPQAYMNFRRKSTLGWSIGNVLLDFTGGILSIAQMFIQSYNNNDWSSIFGDPTKFGLGLFSVVFDVFFMIQHYVLYRNNLPSEPLFETSDIEEDRTESDEEELQQQQQLRQQQQQQQQQQRRA